MYMTHKETQFKGYMLALNKVMLRSFSFESEIGLVPLGTGGLSCYGRGAKNVAK